MPEYLGKENIPNNEEPKLTYRWVKPNVQFYLGWQQELEASQPTHELYIYIQMAYPTARYSLMGFFDGSFWKVVFKCKPHMSLKKQFDELKAESNVALKQTSPSHYSWGGSCYCPMP